MTSPKLDYKYEDWIFGKKIKIPKEWELKKIKDLAEVSVGLVLEPSTYFDDKGTVPMITGKNVREDGIVLDNVDFISEKNNKLLENTRIWSGDLVTMRVGYPGRTSLVKNEHDGINCASVIITRKNKKYVSKFLYYLANSELISQQVIMHQAGSAQKVINISSWKNFLIPVPPLREQEKIGSVLSNIHELIQKQQQVIEQTQKLMKGQMQKLLTKGIGHTKFKKAPWLYHQEIEIPKEWEVGTLDSVCDQIQDMDHKMPKKINKGIPFLSISHIVNKPEIDFSNPEYISEEDYSKFLKKIQPKKNDLLYSRVATIGEVRIIREEKKFAFTYNVVLIKAGKKINSLFLKYMLDFPEIKNHVKILAPQTAQPFLGLGDIQKIKILIPTLSEQEKIASMLSNLDSLIQQEKQYKEKLQKIKRGLMQQLLTGKTRVKV